MKPALLLIFLAALYLLRRREPDPPEPDEWQFEGDPWQWRVIEGVAA